MATEPSSWIASVIDDLLKGRSNVDEAIRAVADHVQDEEERDQEVLAGIALIGRAGSALQVIDITEVVAAAALPLGDSRWAYVLLIGAMRLVTESAAKPAFALIERARTVLSAYPILDLTAREVGLRCLRSLGRHTEVDDTAPALIGEAGELGRESVQAMAEYSWARSLADRGRTVDALDHASAAIDHRARCEPDWDLALYSRPTFLRLRGLLARQAGDIETALTSFESSRDAAIEDALPEEAAFSLSEIAFTWEAIGDLPRAANILEQAAAEADAAGRGDLASSWRRRGEPSADGFLPGAESAWPRALALWAQGPEHDQETIQLLRTVIKNARQRGDVVMEMGARNNLGAALGRAGNRFEAEISFRAAIKMAQDLGDRLREMQARGNLASRALSDARPDLAIPELKIAMSLGESLLRDSASAELRQSLAISVGLLYDLATTAVSARFMPGEWMIKAGHDPQGTVAQPDEALDFGQRARAGNFMDWLRTRDLVAGVGADDCTAAMLGLRAAEVSVELGAAEHRPLGDLLRARRDAAAQLDHALERHGVANERRRDPCTRPELAAALRDDEVLLDLLAVPDGVVLTSVSASGRAETRFVFWPKDERRRTLRRFRRATRETIALELDGRSDPAELDDINAELASTLLAEAADLVQAAAPELRRVRLIITPENELFQLPYWRLATLLEVATISLLPHPAAMPLLRERPPNRSDGAWLAVFDPSESLARSRADVASYRRFVDVAAQGGELLAALPSARCVHFATHGTFDVVSTYRSGLLVRGDAALAHDPLSAPDPVHRPHLGLLTAAQLMARVDMSSCDLAVLAACDSGLPREHDASEFTGLPGALLVAGARNVIASLWPAGDVAAAFVMNEFYAALEAAYEDGSTLPIADALSTARSRLATADRASVVAVFGDDGVPRTDPPFASSVWTDVFQHYGTD